MSINNSFGAMFIGGLATMMIWVMTCTQAYTYFTRKSPDGLAFKAMIAFLCILDTFDSVLIVHFIYFYIISQDGNSLALSLDTWSLDVHNTIEPISDFIIRMMFAHRVFIFSNKNIVLTTWITVFSLTGLVSGLIVTLGSYNGSIEEGIAVLNLAAVTLTDFSITISLCYLLHRSRTGFRRTDSVIRILMMYIVNTGSIMAVGALVVLLDNVTIPPSNSLILFSVAIILSKR